MLAHPTTGGGKEFEKEYGRDLMKDWELIRFLVKVFLAKPLSENPDKLFTATGVAPRCTTKGLNLDQTSYILSDNKKDARLEIRAQVA